jgi:DNA polymerase I-like protein with 3'-5' exonuclease and polymerase domains
MAAKTKNPPPSLDTFEFLLEEGEEYLLNLMRLYRKMKQAKRGSDKYFSLMAEVEAEASRVRARMESVMREGDAITDAMPDDD